MARGRRSSGNGDTDGTMFILPDDDIDDNAHTAAAAGRRGRIQQPLFSFSQVEPDQSQALEAARDHELRKLNEIHPTARNRIVTDLSRMLLFKALSGEVIDRTKVVAEAMGDLHKERIQSALLAEAESRLNDVFGFAVRRVPAQMEQDLPNRYKNRLYLINDVTDDEHGTHSLNIHSSHIESSIEKGVLMTILALAFCKGSSQVRSGTMKGAGKKTRWITEHQLYSLLHRVDENIPSEPPSVDGKKRSRLSSGGRKSLSPLDDANDDGGVGDTPDIDTLLEKFVQLDYLLRDKIEEPEGRESSQTGEDGKVTAYAMGPRSAMEVGRKQIIYFCSNILDEQPDPTMLAEVDEDEENYEEDKAVEGE